MVAEYSECIATHSSLVTLGLIGAKSDHNVVRRLRRHIEYD